MSADLDHGIAAIAEAIIEWSASEPALSQGAQALAQARRTPRSLSPRNFPVCAYWDQALSLARGPRPEGIAAILRGLTPMLSWMQNPNYTEALMGARWLRNYGYVELIGGDGHQRADDVRMGVLMFGPHTLYPPHRHPAEEAYFALGGTADWQRGDEPWQAHPPGAVIHHPPGALHATRTRDEPLLAAYLWWGAVAARAQIVAI
jgi:mannose-6-phosphate isomerase-like protein (cupin superfamily)